MRLPPTSIQSLSSIDEVTLRAAFWICLGGVAAFRTKDLDPSPDETLGNRPRSIRMALCISVIVAAAAVSLGLAARFLEIHRL